MKKSSPAALSRGPDHLDVFVCANDGQVYTSWWPETSNTPTIWSGEHSNGWLPIGGWFPPGATVAAVARSPQQLDVFICGHDGQVYTTWWPGNDHKRWQSVINNSWLSIGGTFPAGAPLTVVARSPSQLDLFVCGLDGRVYTAWWPAGPDSRWSSVVNSGWRSIGGVFPPGTPIAAVARTKDQLDLFICGHDGRVYTSWWPDTTTNDWSGIGDHWRAIGGFFPPGAPVAAVARASDHLDLFICGLDGQVYTSWWSASTDWSGIGNSWMSLKGSFAPGSPVSAISRKVDSLDLFICGHDSNVYTSNWSQSNGWTSQGNNWSSVGGVFPPSTQVSAVARRPSQLDLFIRGYDDQIWTSWWSENGIWSGIGNRWRAIGFPQGAVVASATAAINGKYFALGGQAGFLGEARTQLVNDAGNGCFHMVYNKGAIYWSAANGACVIFGEIYKKWLDLGGLKYGAGFPITDETPSEDGGFRYNLFEKGAAICWTSSTGPHIIQGDIYRKWIAIGGLKSISRVPITDEASCAGGFFNDLRDSSIYWTGGHGAFLVYGDIRRKWKDIGGPASIGCPISDEMDAPGGGRQTDFERGVLTWRGNFDTMVFTPHAGRSRHFTGTIVSGGLAALGGSVEVTVYESGLLRWHGQGHASGLDGHKYGVNAVLRPAASSDKPLPLLSFIHQGSVGGTLTAGSRDDPWDSWSYSAAVLSSFDKYVSGTLAVSTAYSSDIGDFFASFLSFALNWTVGSLLGPVGLVIFIGVEIGSLVTTGSLVPGARVLNSILWLAGPENSLLALAAGAIASLGSRSRGLTAAEYQFAKNQVFANSLPPIDQIILTDIIGMGDRPFTFPTAGGKITVNMGPGAFSDPLSFAVGKPNVERGSVFIHELMHAWQIAHTPMRLSLLADALASQLRGTVSYQYGAPDKPFKDFNLEQQAQMVSDWAFGIARQGTQQTTQKQDPNSPYFKYIIGNIQLGQY